MIKTLSPDGIPAGINAAADAGASRPELNARGVAAGAGSPSARQTQPGWSSGGSLGVAGAVCPVLTEMDASQPAPVSAPARRTLSICDTQPVTAEGVRTLLENNLSNDSGNSTDLFFLERTESLRAALEHVRRDAPDVLILDKAFR